MISLYFVNRIGRIHHRLKPHITAIRKCSDKKIKRQALKKYDSFKKHFKRVRVFLIIRNAAFVLLYASVATAILANTFILAEASDYVAELGGLVGGSILLAIVAIVNHLMNLEIADAYVLSSEIISLSTFCKPAGKKRDVKSHK